MLTPMPNPNVHSNVSLPAAAERNAAAAKSPPDAPRHKLWLMFNPREYWLRPLFSKNKVTKPGYTIISHNPNIIEAAKKYSDFSAEI